MPDENRFAGLGSIEGVDDADESGGADGAAGTEGVDGDEGPGPAFEFEETRAKSLYVRDETLERMDDVEFAVESTLRSEHGVRDVTGREFHDALIRVAAGYPEEIAEAVLEAREE